MKLTVRDKTTMDVIAQVWWRYGQPERLGEWLAALAKARDYDCEEEASLYLIMLDDDLREVAMYLCGLTADQLALLNKMFKLKLEMILEDSEGDFLAHANEWHDRLMCEGGAA